MVITEGEEQSYEGSYERPVDTAGEETTYKGKGIENITLLDGEKTDYDGDPIKEPTTVEGEQTSYKGDIEEKVIDTDGEETSYDGMIPEKITELEGNTNNYDGTLQREDIYTATGSTINLEGHYENPKKLMAPEYNKPVYTYELAESSSYANYTSSLWEGFQSVPKEVYTISGAQFPSHFPDVKGNPVRDIGYMTEAYLPIVIETYTPIATPYVTEDVLLETNFQKGKYASSMKQKRGVGFEYPGTEPAYFAASQELINRGWYTGSAKEVQIPYFILDNFTSSLYPNVDTSDEEVIVDEDGSYLIDGPSGSLGGGELATPDLGKNETPILRTGRPKTFEIRKLRRYDKENLVANKFNDVQALYFENEHSASSFNLSSNYWPFTGLEVPVSSYGPNEGIIDWEVNTGVGFYSRFGTKGTFPFYDNQLYLLDFELLRDGQWNRHEYVSVHLLENLEDDIDVENKGKEWGSTLIEKCYKTSGYRKVFAPSRSGTFRIVFVIHGGVDEDGRTQNPIKFYLTQFKLSEFTRAKYNSPSFYSTAMNNLFYEGCKNTIETTTDGLSPIEVTETNPSVLVVDPDGSTDLDVI